MDKVIADMASETCDSELLVIVSGGSDLIATEAKYHFTWLTKYRNRYHALQRAQACSHSSSSTSARAKAQALAEFVVHIENNIEQGTFFKAWENYMLTMKNVLDNLA